MRGEVHGNEKSKHSGSKKRIKNDPDYAYTQANVIKNWIHLLIFIAVFAALSVITLEFIDKDKR